MRKELLFKLIIALLSLGLMIFTFSCGSDDDGEEEERDPGIYGLVLDANDNPIADARLHLANFWEPSSQGVTSSEKLNASGNSTNSILQENTFHQNYPNPFPTSGSASTTFFWTLANNCRIRLYLDHWSGDYSYYIDPMYEPDDVEHPGEHYYFWTGLNPDLRFLSNGFYRCRLEGGFFGGTIMFCFERPIEEITFDDPPLQVLDGNVLESVISDENGEFYINSANAFPWPDDETRIVLTDENGQELGDGVFKNSIEFVSVKNGYQNCVVPVDIDITTAMDVTFRMTTSQ